MQECVHLGLSISIVKKICSVLFALDESWTACPLQSEATFVLLVA